MLRHLVLLGVLVGVVALAIQLMILLDVNVNIYNHRPGKCVQIPEISKGSEDITLVDELGLAFVSSGVYYFGGRSDATGEIFLLDMKEKNPKPVQLKLNGITDKKTKFRPHGLSHWYENGKLTLFVIAHTAPEMSTAVVLFSFDEKKKELTVIKTVKDEKIFRGNDLVAVGPEQFIIGNDGSAMSQHGHYFELLFIKRAGSIVYYDGKNAHYLAESSISPNGMIVDRQRKHLFVSHVNAKQLGIYKLAKDFKSIELKQTVQFSSHIDNFYIDSEGALWTGSHPVTYKTFHHLSQPENNEVYSPSHILRVKFSEDYGKWEIREVFADDGRELSGSSVAVIYGTKLLMGTVFRQTMICHIQDSNILN